ncbi:MAG: UMP kinase, partial [Clostridia bacterium]|nr:UMP kinase [Clostridia bacterium]
MNHSPFLIRVVMGYSAEALKGNREHGYDSDAVLQIVAKIRQALDSGVEIALVVGAGNIWRGLAGAKNGMDRVTADHMGMLGTVMN